MTWLALIASAILLLISIWIVVPAPSDFLYQFAVGSPEAAPALFAGGILLMVLAARLSGVVIEAGAALLAKRTETIAEAGRTGVYLYGITARELAP